MARPTATPGQELSVDNVNLDDLSLDDDALFADLDNEVRLEGAGDDSLALGGKDDLDLNFDVEALPSGKGGNVAARSGNGKAAAKADDLRLDLDDAKLSNGDINLDLDEGTSGGGDFNLDLDGGPGGGGDLDLEGGTGGDLNLDLDAPTGSASGSGDSLDLDVSDVGTAAASGGDMMDLDIPGGGGSDELNLELEPPQPEAGPAEDMFNLELGEPAAPKDMPMSDELDLTLDMEEPGAAASSAGGNDLDLNLDLDEPTKGTGAVGLPGAASEAVAAAGEPELESFELDMGEASMTADVPGGSGMAVMDSPVVMDVDDRSHAMGADQLEEMTLSDETAGPVGMTAASGPVLDLGALPAADEVEAPTEEFQAVPDLDLDSVDLNLDQSASEFKAVPDVDLDTVDLSLNMPMAETHGDAGAPVATTAPVAEIAVPEASHRMFTGMGTGTPSKLEVAKEELLELNLADLESKQVPASAMMAPPSQTVGRPKVPASQAAAEPPAAASTDVGSVLMSISHQVQVRMGSVSLLGQDLLNLAHGSVVPLNRAIGEPVDLTLEGKTIAQGEIVVINGRKLGVRIVALSK